MDPAHATFGPYTLLREIARGGMGIVYLAEDLAGIRVALKLPRPELATDPHDRTRFLSEMRLTASLHHPNIVQILQGGEERGHLYIAMEYVDGSTLRAEIDRRGRIPPLEAVRIATQIARGLAAAHEHQPAIVHRDLKPGNILLRNDGVAKITDFGIAKAFDVGAQATTSPMGTPIYMSPEQLNGDLSSPASDVHALGAILYEALAGTPPFSASLPLARLIHAICFDVPPAIGAASGLATAIVPELDALVADCLAKAPERRPPAANVAARLYEIETRLLAGPHAPTPPRPAAPPPIDTIALVQRLEQRRSPAPVIAAIGLAVVAIGTTTWWLSRNNPIAEAPATRSIAAPNRDDPPVAPPPSQKQPGARPAPIPRPTPDPPKPVTPTILEGLTTAEGPFGGLDEFCRGHRAADRESSDFVTCEIAKGDAAASVVLPRLGIVTAVETGEGVFEHHYGLQFESDDFLRTTHVLPKLATTGGGNAEFSIIEEIRIVAADGGQAHVDFVIEHSERIEERGKSGADMDYRKTRVTTSYVCGLSPQGAPGCRLR